MIVEKRRFPSPSQHVRLYTICYLSNGLRVKGLLAEPAEPGQYDGFLYLRGGIKSVGMVRPGRIIQFASQGFVVFAPFTEAIKEEKAMRILPEKTGRMHFLLFACFSSTQMSRRIESISSVFPAAELWECSLRSKWAGRQLHLFPGEASVI